MAQDAEAKEETTLVVITGANRGIGLEFATQLLQRDNYCVVALCRNPEKAEQLKLLQEKYKGRVSVEKLELIKDADIENVAKSLKDKPVDVLILNAGIIGNMQSKLGSLQRDEMLNVFNVNVVGTMLLGQALWDNVKASKRKQIIGISSGMGSIGDCGSNSVLPYRCSKTALNMAFQSFKHESVKNKLGVHAMLLNPGWVQTGLGGANATKSPTESVQQMLAIIDNYEKLNNGGFYNYDGKTFDGDDIIVCSVCTIEFAGRLSVTIAMS
eukprot:CAMPEP_0197057494 /NCGR_PEP_ID=MMETSP1384-20130603/97722_1 /TAXON_ID=29189 /ORGANISM="Ammonia sp." /LENGTH=268 /DNA_ID=CAMNT_0042491939 /DNA_START=18 /DNA_END=822 /DNA_ORIENTATION=+